MTNKAKTIKFIVSDMDGTLFEGHRETIFDLSLRNEEALKKIKDSNIEFCVSSGRMVDFGIQLLKKYGFSKIRVAGFNGAVCSDCGKIVSTLPIPYSTLSKIIPIIKTKYSSEFRSLQLQTLTSERLFLPNDESSIQSYQKDIDRLGIGRISKTTIDDYLKDPKDTMIGKLSFYMPSKDRSIQAINDLRSATSDGSIFITMSSDTLVEIVNPNAGKDNFVSYLRKTYNLSKDEIAVIGDAPNDRKMFSESNFRFAMASGDESLKSDADFIVNDVAECIDYCINYNKGKVE
ncbi:hypothetical protein M9Y10_030983 [Tritrichomonas musculus]|uniref:Haloacid dehalogenase-like hydrolase family protein n=1 Tax=Tritrichomonas musculus TaxID=1915356 RepID=A0ABR2H3L1_9EUKA